MYHTLYRFWNKDSELLYIGISLNAIARLSQHAKDKDWYPEIASTTMENFNSREDLEQAEREAIINEKPKYNVVYNKASVRPPSIPRNTETPQKETHDILALRAANWACKYLSVNIMETDFDELVPIYVHGGCIGKGNISVTGHVDAHGVECYVANITNFELSEHEALLYTNGLSKYVPGRMLLRAYNGSEETIIVDNSKGRIVINPTDDIEIPEEDIDIGEQNLYDGFVVKERKKRKV